MTTATPAPAESPLPHWWWTVKLALGGFLLIFIPAYWWYYGPVNFLWICDVALLLTALTVFTGRRAFVGMAGLLSLVPEMIWNLDFLTAALSGWFPIGITNYMWDETIPLGIRALSLFHLPLVALIIYLIWRMGYDRRTFFLTTALVWVLLPMTYLLTEPAKNTNWAFGLGHEPQQTLHPLLYLTLIMIALPVLLLLPMHLLLRRWRGDRDDVAST